jgi:predicted DNA binding CopG/RHH family protein
LHYINNALKQNNMSKTNVNVKKGVQGFLPVEDKRDRKVIFCLTNREFQELVDKAEQKGLNKSDYLRMLINKDNK